MTYINHGFRICHHLWATPRKGENGCYKYADHRDVSDNHLHHFIDDRIKMAQLLSMIDIGPHLRPDYKGPMVDNLRDYVEFMRRLTIPYYEEARQYWSIAKADGFFEGDNELSMYSTDHLKRLIEEYGE
jgi:hypothetical protein